ncbi:GILT-like protein 1 [Ischnura elegans]|uniref:GILT-like protein 1 n=1 Tax=Ischnura elegans TaxID=197161 RepID=UPI001ED8749A|nr:GILT-like protein 1 [Ischnura elegans]XP_046400784.1 GILT-like protein 1 [Ischnura elegans]
MFGRSYVALAAFMLLALSSLPASQQKTIVKGNASCDKLKIGIYYESLCPDSIRFVLTQLPRAYASLKEYIDITFVPFGKAYTKGDPDGDIEFVCQHGQIECEGNRMQSCALSFIPDPDKRAQFVPCVMNGTDPRVLGPKCAAEIGLNYGDVERCYATDEGLNLQLQAQSDTYAIQNPLNFVPTIVYNGDFNQDLQDSSLSDFEGTICRQLPCVSCT